MIFGEIKIKVKMNFLIEKVIEFRIYYSNLIFLILR